VIFTVEQGFAAMSVTSCFSRPELPLKHRALSLIREVVSAA